MGIEVTATGNCLLGSLYSPLSRSLCTWVPHVLRKGEVPRRVAEEASAMADRRAGHFMVRPKGRDLPVSL
jgi:hypothetical protein